VFAYDQHKLFNGGAGGKESSAAWRRSGRGFNERPIKTKNSRESVEEKRVFNARVGRYGERLEETPRTLRRGDGGRAERRVAGKGAG